jgi:hypothetical protein
MVGDYSDSVLLQDAVQGKLSSKHKMMAVPKGAVIFGHCPESITQRVSKYTPVLTLPLDLIQATSTGKKENSSLFRSLRRRILHSGQKRTGFFCWKSKHKSCFRLFLGIKLKKYIYRIIHEYPKFVTDSECN